MKDIFKDIFKYCLESKDTETETIPSESRHKLCHTLSAC